VTNVLFLTHWWISHGPRYRLPLFAHHAEKHIDKYDLAIPLSKHLLSKV